MKKFLVGLLIAGSAVVLGAVVSKLLKSKNSDTDYDDDDFDYDYPEEFGDDEENIDIDDTDLDDELDADYLVDTETEDAAEEITPAEEEEE